MGSIPVGDSDFFFVPRSRHVEYPIFSYVAFASPIPTCPLSEAQLRFGRNVVYCPTVLVI